MGDYMVEVIDAVKQFKDTTALNHVSVKFEDEMVLEKRFCSNVSVGLCDWILAKSL